GFGGKWLIYTSLIEKGWYLQAGLALFVSAMAFLYCFRLIHTIFLGQPKERYSEIKEAPGWIIAPQYILIAAIMAFSAFPKLLIKPLSAAVVPFFSSAMAWEGSKLTNSLGYWNGNLVMMIVVAVFVLLLLLLLLIMRKPQKVKQFNIVYAAERPERPEVTHYAHNFYAPYNKALGFLIRPAVTRFWEGVSEGFRATGGALRMIYNGNAQTYLLHIVLFVVALYFVLGGF
ncbi:NADH-quinone oxidoreductase subunit F, partial [bacterium]|nr:NADH-quinone oxidoreductase subunit F [bacterium]